MSNLKNLLKQALDTKEKLYLLALDSYLNTGAHHTNFQALANQLGISQAAIYKHFNNKEHLLVESINYAAIKGREFIDSEENLNDPALKRLQHYFKMNLDFCIEHRIYSIAVITLHYFASCVPEVKKLHDEINQKRISKIESFLHQAKNEGKIGDINIKETAYFIHSMLMGEMIKAHLWPNEKSSTARNKYIWLQVEKLLK